MPISWYPLQAGELWTAEKVNELVAAIQDGSIFTSVSFVSDLVTTLDSRVASLEADVAILNQSQNRSFIKQQVTLTAGQSVIPLTHTPILDSEQLILNGMGLAKSGIPIGYSGDYSLSGSTVTLVNELALQIQDGDLLVVNYSYVNP